MATKEITAKLDEKRVIAYFKKQARVFVQNTEHDYYIGDGFVSVKIPNYIDIAPFHLLDNTTHNSFTTGGKDATVSTWPDMASAWAQWAKLDLECEPKLTHELLEIANSSKGKPGSFYRKFLANDASVYYSKTILDMFSPDLAELEDFFFERLTGYNRGLMRISAKYGHVAYVMPCEPKNY